jgi:hypothetical protein
MFYESVLAKLSQFLIFFFSKNKVSEPQEGGWVGGEEKGERLEQETSCPFFHTLFEISFRCHPPSRYGFSFPSSNCFRSPLTNLRCSNTGRFHPVGYNICPISLVDLLREKGLKSLSFFVISGMDSPCGIGAIMPSCSSARSASSMYSLCLNLNAKNGLPS